MDGTSAVTVFEVVNWLILTLNPLSALQADAKFAMPIVPEPLPP